MVVRIAIFFVLLFAKNVVPKRKWNKMVRDMNQKPERREHIKSLGKGLSVLIAVNESGPAKISTLTEATSLPKPTLIRMLNTLMAEGFVAKQSPKEGAGAYIAAPKVRRLSSAFAQGSLLAQISQRPLNDLCEIIKWPSEVLIPDGLSMVIEVGNRQVSPITLKYFEQRRFPILTSAAGKAYLSRLNAHERNQIITAALALAGEDSAHRFARARARADTALETVRRKGYSYQDYDAPIAGTRVYAVPLMQENRALAALAMPSLRDVLSLDDFEAAILPRLEEVAAEIGKELVLHSRSGLR